MAIPQLARARNARLIMSNIIPDGMEDPRVQPYCIWIPDVASVDTYRKLVHRYPAMLYQVGRACGAAGYADLYKELVKGESVVSSYVVRLCSRADILT